MPTQPNPRLTLYISVDYATDELIGKTIRQYVPNVISGLSSNKLSREFAESTILTIAHRIRTIIDYDKVYSRLPHMQINADHLSHVQVMVLEQGRVAEFDTPANLLSNPSSKFNALCKATGKSEFAMLQKLAGVT